MKISVFKKEEKEPPEPQYYTSATNMPTLNYKVYYMSKVEKLLYSLLAFAVGAGVGYLFYGGMGKNEFGDHNICSEYGYFVHCRRNSGKALYSDKDQTDN